MNYRDISLNKYFFTLLFSIDKQMTEIPPFLFGEFFYKEVKGKAPLCMLFLFKIKVQVWY